MTPKIKIVLSILAILAPIAHTLLAVALMVIADLITGLISAKRRKEPITSAGLRRTISKVLIFEAALCFGYLAEHFIPGSLPFTNLVGGYISLTEMTSIMENLNGMVGGSLLQTLIKTLGSGNGS